MQECAAGLVPITVEGTGAERLLRLQLPEPRLRDLSDAEQARLGAILGAAPVAGTRAALVDVGARWIVAELESVETLITLAPDSAASARFETELAVTGLTLFARHGAAEDGIEVRSFAPSCGVPEDPVCGSGNGAVAAYLRARGDLAEGASYTATQGRILVGGQAVTTVAGRIGTG